MKMQFTRLAASASLVFFTTVASLVPSAVFATNSSASYGITLNVYQVCADDGSNCAALGPMDGDTFFAAATNKIYAQLGILVSYDFAGQIDNSLFLNIDDRVAGKTFTDIARTTGHLQSATVVDMFLVHTLDNSEAYGEGWQGAGGLVMGMDTILGFAPGGRIDTMAHELGHNLGLDPESDPQYAGPTDPGHSNDPNQLMSSGSIRNVPLTLADITPDGNGYDQVSQFQTDIALKSTLLNPTAVPEPETWGLMLLGLGGLALRARKRRIS